MAVGDLRNISGLIGGVFVVSTIVIFVVGVPETRTFALAALVLGVMFGLYRWLRQR